MRVEKEVSFQENIEYLKSFGKTFIKLKNSKKALKYFKSALKIDNNDFESCLNIGECYLKLENIEKANKYLSFCKNIESSIEERRQS